MRELLCKAGLLLSLLAGLSWAVNIEWVLLDGATGEPLDDIPLVVESDTLRTDAQGLVLQELPEGRLEARVQLLVDTLALPQFVYTWPTGESTVQVVLEARRVLPQSTSTQGSTAKADSAMEAMVVVADRAPLHDRKEVARRDVHREEMRQVAATQNDPLHVLRTFPGVASQNDLSQRPYVRGGSDRETRVFWNGVPTVQPYHALSAYSIFNMESIEDMAFYSGGFPAEGSNSLSGALLLRSRPAPLDSVVFWTQLSMLKGHAYLGVPLIKDKLGIYGSYQAFLYDWVIKRIVNIAAWTEDNPQAKQELEDYTKFIDLPNFKDGELGATWAVKPGTLLHYSWLHAQDIWRMLDYREVWEETNPDSTAQAIMRMDTLALIDRPNDMHALRLTHVVNSRWSMEVITAFQSQEWKVQFDNSDPDEPIFDYERMALHGRVKNLLQWRPNHLLNFGGMWDYRRDLYDVSLPRIVHEMIVGGSVDFMESVGFLHPDGHVVTRDSGPFGSIAELSKTLVMNYEGRTQRQQVGLWISDSWKRDANNRFEIGTRIDVETPANSFFLSPRVAWYHKLRANQELTLAAGLYAQDDYEFYYRHFNKDLVSEKAWHLNGEWSWDITPHYRLEISNYFKGYYDLTSGRVVPTGNFSAWDMLEFLTDFTGIDADAYLEQLAADEGRTVGELRDNLDAYTDELLAALPVEYREPFLQVFGEKRLDFSNEGIGIATGSEVSLRYDPVRNWRGWLSAEISGSWRRDREGEPWYPFRRHRPWAIKWHNYFDMPGDWEMSLRLEHSAGMVYTGFTEYSEYFDGELGDTLFVVEQKNNRRYMPYTRGDIRLERNTTLFGHPFKVFSEVWNIFNSPNFILRDSETTNFRFIDMSYPYPIFFSGVEFRW